MERLQQEEAERELLASVTMISNKHSDEVTLWSAPITLVMLQQIDDVAAFEEDFFM